MRDSVLVTGCTGTFGRAFLRAALAANRWRRVVGFSRDEVKHAALFEEFGREPALRLVLGDVRSEATLRQAMWGVAAVVHAAALKRVDQGCYSPGEMVATNILGTMNVVNAAIQAGVGRVVVLSSDKSVNATNIYGATKFCAESYAVQANAYGGPQGTRVAAVRYGNILGSRGSVVHVWRAQAARGEALTLTDPRMTRFVMTIEQAVELVLYALDAAEGGEVFVPVLPAATMVSLLHAVVPASPRAPIRVVGLRPGGEKLAERLLNEEEPARTQRVGRYFRVLPALHDWTAGAAWEGPCLDPAFEYRSDRAERLTVGDLRRLIEGTEACQ